MKPRSYRAGRDDLHPSIWQALDNITMGMGMVQGDSRVQASIAQHSRVWGREYGSNLFRWIAGGFALTILLIVLGKAMDFQNLKAIGILAITLGSASAVVAFARNMRTATGAELEALTGALAATLTANQLSYLNAVIQILKSPLLDDGARRSLLAQLRGVLDESERINGERERLLGHIGASESNQSLDDEYRQLSDRLAATQDASARASLQQAIDLCDRRRSSRDRFRPLVERAEAQQAIIDQTFRHVAETFASSSPVATGQLVSDAALPQIQDRLADLHAQSAAFQDAVNEVERIHV